MQWERNPLLILNNWLKFYIVCQCLTVKKITPWDFPGGPVVKTPPNNAGCEGLSPGWVTKILHAVWYSQNFFKNYFLTLLLLVTRKLSYNHIEGEIIIINSILRVSNYSSESCILEYPSRFGLRCFCSSLIKLWLNKTISNEIYSLLFLKRLFHLHYEATFF